ncbi:FkbM family methyltransferase [Telmatospirillum sp.]|uniref:FkbM family methyltransferase n=1 Tax=Telmatospirillum sp. TaxID=2079197 RepID=UPI0028414861|nr:FkbM family methyltransferase [Telmatospirillum sp.]MDR3436956.1 FkbM family methyltransferase [Telmatospirillum sp.]
MILNENEMNTFTNQIAIYMKILKENYNVNYLSISPNKNSIFYLENDLKSPIDLHIPLDAGIGRGVLIRKSWDLPKINFIKLVTRETKSPLCLVDVGTNIGLITRECIGNVENIKTAYAYEPHPSNFSLLSKNFSGIERININLINAGLGKSNGTLNFYLDPDNAGNYSLNINAMPANMECSSIKVEILSANEEKEKWLQNNEAIVYKSDTQGYDEIIATSYDLSFWDHVKCGIFELWRIDGKEYDRDKFCTILDKFTHRVFGANPTRNVSVKEVDQYLYGCEGDFDDLLIWND